MSYNNVRKKVEYKNILIVEDDAELREKLYNYFSAMNTVTAVSELKKAVEAVQNIEFDVKLI